MGYFTNFNRIDDPIVGDNWEEQTSAAYSIFSNQLRAVGGNGFLVDRCLRPSSEAFADGTMAVDFVFRSNLNTVPNVQWRLQGGTATSGYILFINAAAGTLSLARLDSGGLTVINSQSFGSPLVIGVAYRFEADFTGSSQSGLVRRISDSAVLATVAATDATYLTPGRVCVSVNGAGTTDFDNFSTPESPSPGSSTDTFNRTDSSNLGNAWDVDVPANYQILNNKLRTIGDGSTTFSNNKCLRPLTENFVDGIVQIDFEFIAGTGIASIPNVFGRLQGPGSKDGYILFVDITAAIFKFGSMAGGAVTELDTAVIATLVEGVKYQIILDMTGASFTGTLKNRDTSSTIATLSATDSTYSFLGRSGVSIHTTGTIDYDNFISGIARIDTVLAAGDIGILERFDTDLSNWVIDNTAGSVSIQTLDEDEKLQINDTSATLYSSAVRTLFLTLDSKFIVELDMHGAAGSIGYFDLLDVDGLVLATIKNDASLNQGSFLTDSVAATTFTWTAATYKMIVLLVDVAGNTVSAWHSTGDGSVVSNWPQIGTAKAFSGATIKQIRCRSDNTAQGEIRFDEIKILKPKIFCLGDSNTAGFASGSAHFTPIPSSSNRTDSFESETHSFPFKLGQNSTPAAWCINRGVNGDKTADIDARVQSDVIDQGAVKCVYMAGTNDIIASIPASTIQANIASTISKLTAAGVKVILCTIPPADNWTTTQNTIRDDVNSWILAQRRAGVMIADTYLAVRDFSFPDNRLPAYADASNEHFNDAGLQAIADTVFAAETAIFGQGVFLSQFRNRLVRT